MSRKTKLVTVSMGVIALCATAFQLGSKIVEHSDGRNPAAIPKIYDYSHLEGSALLQASQDRLINGAKVISAGRNYGIELGHFVTKNSNGQSVGACEVYEQVELVFYAGGMAVSGDSPQMTVLGPCEPGDDLNVISPVMISADKILQTPVRDQEISDFSDSSITVKFENVSDTWPRVWILQSARLLGSRSGEIKADSKDISRVLGKAPYFDWQ